jgi:malonate transporter
MTKVLADALVPIFAGLILGYFAGLWRQMDNKHVQTLITFVMSFAVPSSIFLAIASTPRGALRQQAAAALVLTVVDSSPKRASSALIASYVIGTAALAAWIVIVNHLG